MGKVVDLRKDQNNQKIKELHNGLMFTFANKYYEVRNIPKTFSDKLNVYVKVIYDNKFHIDILNLYSSGARDRFVNRNVQKFNFDYPESIKIEDEIMQIINIIEERQKKTETETTQKGIIAIPEKEKREAIKYATVGNDYLDKVADDMTKLGYVGEELNKKLCILVSISRLLDNPLSCIIRSRASAGKSKLLEMICEFTPDEDVKKITRLTPQALYYNTKNSFTHKLLAIEEQEGIAGADYVIRTMQTSKTITLVTTIKEPNTGKMTSVEHKVEGPVSIIMTTTRPKINFENETRCLITSLDESEEQTKRIHKAIAHSRTKAGFKEMFEVEKLKNLHKNFQRTLKKLKVFNPYSERLKFPTKQLHSRRLRNFYEGLIETIAFIKQHRKPIKIGKLDDGSKFEYIEVEPDDIRKANEMMVEIIGQTLDDLSKSSKRLLEIIRNMVKEKSKELNISSEDYEFTRRTIREYSGWSDMQVKTHIKQLVDLEYVSVKSGRKGKRYIYELNQNTFIKGSFNLTDIIKLR